MVFTNFHLPKSTLILVSALMGIEECKEMYTEAIKESIGSFRMVIVL